MSFLNDTLAVIYYFHDLNSLVMSKFTKKDAAKATGVTIKEVSRTWHQAKDDAQKSGELPERAANKASKAYTNSSSSSKKGGGKK